MNSDLESELENLFRRIPLLSGLRLQDFRVEPLAGYTNRNYHLYNDLHDWVLRIPRATTNAYINRRDEAYNQAMASKLGLAPQRLWWDESGLSLTETLRHTRSLDQQDLHRQEIIDALLTQLRCLHRSESEFQGKVELAPLISRYFELVPKPKQAALAAEMGGTLQALQQIAAWDLLMVASHNDLVLENLLIDNRGALHIIDWEYAAQASPYWDLATVCNAAEFDREASAALLQAYARQVGPLELDILMHYRRGLTLLSACWLAAFVPGA